jgi:hypothetical protein
MCSKSSEHHDAMAADCDGHSTARYRAVILVCIQGPAFPCLTSATARSGIVRFT